MFLDLLELNPSKKVLEIGVGTGRIAEKIAGCCRHLTGIDISPKTVERARENLRLCPNITLICDDFISHPFRETFDIIYSTLTMMHFQDKPLVIDKISALLNDSGLVCQSTKTRVNGSILATEESESILIRRRKSRRLQNRPA